MASSSRRLGVENSRTRAQLVEAADQILIEEGYHAVTARRVAQRAGLKPQLVHYYFRTMDDLLVAVFRRATDAYLEQHERALASEQPLRALWAINSDASGTKRTMEFIALGTHRETIRAEIVDAAERFRRLQIEVVSRELAARGANAETYPPAAGVILLMAAISRALVTESTLGISLGHAELRGIAERMLEEIEPSEKGGGGH